MYVDSEFGVVRRGGLPGTLMSHAVLDSDQPVRAMIVLAGNPVLSIGGEERLRKAFEQLDLLVCVDLYRNATGELAGWVLPATDQFEREDLNIVNIGTSHRPFAQYTPAVVEPAGERRPEWWIVAALLQAMGRPSLLDDEQPDPWSKWRHMLARRGIELDALADEVHVLVPPTPGRFYDDQVQTVDARVDCCPTAFGPAIERCATIFAELSAEPVGRLKMITKRDQWMHNSWFSNLERMKRSRARPQPVGHQPVRRRRSAAGRR